MSSSGAKVGLTPNGISFSGMAPHWDDLEEKREGESKERLKGKDCCSSCEMKGFQVPCFAAEAGHWFASLELLRAVFFG